MDLLLSDLTVWHWVGLALILIAIEMMLGTFDLLWVSIAAAVAALFTGFAPEAWTSWTNQIIVFAVMSCILVILGRTMFADARNAKNTSHPTLNARGERMVGKRAIVAGEFSAGVGRVKFGDTEWRAEASEDHMFSVGQEVEITAASGSTVTIKPVS